MKMLPAPPSGQRLVCVSLLTVEIVGEPFKRSARGHRYVNCVCVCGTQLQLRLADVRSGHTTSCGCLRDLAVSAAASTHGERNSPTYQTWRAMRRRCYDPKFPSYRWYGKLGVRVCPEWNDSHTGYSAFVRDVGHRPPDITLDRIDPMGNYSPGNVRWADNATQAVNKRGKGYSDWRRDSSTNEGEEWAYWDEIERTEMVNNLTV